MRLLKSLLVFLLLCSPVFASDPEGLVSYPPQKLMGFRGLDTRSTKPTIADSRASDLLNIVLSPTLDLKKRPGYSIINGTLDHLDMSQPAIVGIFDSLYSTGTSHTYAFLGNQVLYDNAGTWTRITGSTLTSNDNAQYKCVMALDYAICTDDEDLPMKINVTPARSPLNFTGLTYAITKARTVIWYRNYLIFGNTYENSIERPTRFRWSNVGTVETYTDDDFADISTFAGDEIVGFSEIYGELYIFLTNSIWKASLVGGYDVFVFSKIIDGIGAISTHSIQSILLSDERTAVIFTDDKKRVLMFNGATITDIGALIQPNLDNLNESRLFNSVATFDGDNYILSASTSGISSNDICYAYNTSIGEWMKWDQIDANAFAQVKETNSVIKTYFGNYESFVYWMDNPDLYNDVDGAAGVVDSVGTITTATITGAQAIIDSALPSGAYTGAIIKIVSGTGVGQESVIATNLSADTGVAVMTAFSTNPDSTSVYSIGAIDGYYTAKPYDFGDSSREKQMLGMLFWAEEASNNSVDVSYAEDFGSTLASQTVSISPSGSSLWDTALWDVGTWGTTGDKIYTTKFTGQANFIEPKFSNNDIDASFHLYGFNLLGIAGDTKQ